MARHAVPVTVCSPSPRGAEPWAACPGHQGCSLLLAPRLGRLLTVTGQFCSLWMLVFKTRCKKYKMYLMPSKKKKKPHEPLEWNITWVFWQPLEERGWDKHFPVIPPAFREVPEPSAAFFLPELCYHLQVWDPPNFLGLVSWQFLDKQGRRASCIQQNREAGRTGGCFTAT